MKKIFIADDDQDILDILQLMLESQGYEVWATTAASDIFDNGVHEADLILLDVWMSGVDGRDICRRLQNEETTHDIPIIFISANSRLPEIATEYKVYGYIAKPFDMEDLFKTVNNVFA